ncbi:3676_t:CDS:2 [Cetraspora pellucida]|uniref:3676_t:CDS:1 n=1 Tax=Cetraspora pellucida TaxID=1433469 RepID=A0A9N9CI88_9GLOM|nr:3676_t:CDS:2 [Cetraspora pellucida]
MISLIRIWLEKHCWRLTANPNHSKIGKTNFNTSSIQHTTLSTSLVKSKRNYYSDNSKYVDRKKQLVKGDFYYLKKAKLWRNNSEFKGLTDKQIVRKLRSKQLNQLHSQFWEANYKNPNFELLKEFPLWLKGNRLIKFTPCFEGMTLRQIINLNEKELEQIGIHRFAARKILVDCFGFIRIALGDPKNQHYPKDQRFLDMVITKSRLNESE